MAAGSPLLRRMIGVVAGTVGAVAVIFLIEATAHALYFPVGVAPDSATIEHSVAAAPAGAKLLVVLAWFAGSAVGGALALRLSGWQPAAPIIAALLAASGIALATHAPHPLWMVIAAVAAPLLGGLAALPLARWSARRSEERL